MSWGGSEKNRLFQLCVHCSPLWKIRIYTSTTTSIKLSADGKSDPPTEDWTLQLHSLEHSTENNSQLDLQLSCTASASSGPSISWHVYFPLCGVWDSLHNVTELGMLVEESTASPCLKTSTLTVYEYAERGYHGALIVCTAYATWKSTNQSANLTIPGK